jgi:sugar lactone lactonase YvrE
MKWRLLFVFIFPVLVKAQSIITVAGNNIASYSGDGGSAIFASLNAPQGVAMDNVGNILACDKLNNRIRIVTSSGFIHTFAGNGTAGFSGDGGLSIYASFNNPHSVATDNHGNIFISDNLNHRIRKIYTSGIITTVGGNGTAGYSGDGGVATSAQLNHPEGIFVDDTGNIFIADTYNHRIRKINPAGTITTVAGNGIAGFNGDSINATMSRLNFPSGILADNGNLFITDQQNNRIRIVDTSGKIFTIAGSGSGGFSGDGGRADTAKLNKPKNIKMDNNGNLYVADRDNHAVRKLTKTYWPTISWNISTVAGNAVAGFSGDGASATVAQLNHPSDIVFNEKGDMIIADQNNNVLREVVALPVPSFSFLSSGVCVDSCYTFINTSKGTGIDSIYWSSSALSIATPFSDTLHICFPFVGDTWLRLYAHNISGGTSVTQIFKIYTPEPYIANYGGTLQAQPAGTGVYPLYTIYTYQWYYNGILIPGATTKNYNPTANGTYKVEVTGPCGIGHRSIVLTNLSIENTINFSLQIYPNPSKGTINFAGIIPNSESVNIEVFDVVGKRVFTKVLSEQELLSSQVNLGKEVPSGTYILHFSSEKINEYARLLIDE